MKQEFKSLSQEELSKVFPNVPKSFLPKQLDPIGYIKFKGDKMPPGWSVNEQFEVGKNYPVYDSEGVFVVGKDGKGYKIVPSAWSKIKF